VPLRFGTHSGVLTATRNEGWIGLDLPARRHAACEMPPELEQLFSGRYVHVVYSVDRFIVELSSAAAVRDFVPDSALLKKYRCVITARGEDEGPYDFISRYFALPVGFLEDPVTGTAHCSLAPYWAERLGKKALFAYQASPRSLSRRQSAVEWRGRHCHRREDQYIIYLYCNRSQHYAQDNSGSGRHPRRIY